MVRPVTYLKPPTGSPLNPYLSQCLVVMCLSSTAGSETPLSPYPQTEKPFESVDGEVASTCRTLHTTGGFIY